MDLVPRVWAWDCCLFSRPCQSIASANAVASAAHELEAGVPSSKCVDMLEGVGAWVGGRLTGLEFPELSRKVKLSSTVPTLIELWVKH